MTLAPPIHAVVAMANNGTIGRDGALPWHLRADLQLFRRLTMGHALLMGRKTYESIGKPLPGRETFVLTKQPKLEIAGVKTVQTIDEVYSQLGSQILFVVGGAEIYRQLLPLCQVVHLTKVLAEPVGDAKLSPIDLSHYRCTEQMYLPANAENDWPSMYQRWQR
ncbi:MAG: dihydrofolate reductase [Pirellula sp.]|jgi:dihydrofolate reductase|nr:dihydrofolate reductase [Pirellula sp.]